MPLALGFNDGLGSARIWFAVKVEGRSWTVPLCKDLDGKLLALGLGCNDCFGR